jgi:hypothetical protein
MQSPTGAAGGSQQQKLRRPTSVQIRSSHAPFLSSRRSGSVTPPPVNRQRSASQTNPTSMHALHLLANGPHGTATLEQEAAVHKHISSAIALSASTIGGGSALQVAELAAAGIAAASTVHPGAGPTSIPSLPSMPDLTALRHPKPPRDPRGAGLKTVRSNVELGSAAAGATRPSLLQHNALQQRHRHQRSATPPRSGSPTASELLRGSSRRALTGAGTRSPPPDAGLPPLPPSFAAPMMLPMPGYPASPPTSSPSSPGAFFALSPTLPSVMAPPPPMPPMPMGMAPPTPPPSASRSARASVLSISELGLADLPDVPPPIPPMNPNRLRAKYSAPNLTKLPPPMPPPSGPLPSVPREVTGV